jgi:hypothetical protein
MFYLVDVAIFIVLLVALVSDCFTQRSSRNRMLGKTVELGFSVAFLFFVVISAVVATQVFNAVPLLGAMRVFVVGFLFASTFYVFYEREIALNSFKQTIRKLRNLRGINLALVIYLVGVWLMTFLLTLAPPNGADYDSLTYHLAAPAQYLQFGQILELPYDHHTYFPFTMEMLYLLGLALQGPVLAKLFHWLMLPLCCVTLIAMGRKHLRTQAGLWAAALFASIPLVQTESTTAYVDIGFTAFVLLAFLCFSHWMNNEENQSRGWWLAWCGVFCGLAMGTKYFGALFWGFLGLCALGIMARRKQWQIKPLLLFGMWALLIGGGWYVRNWMWTGNPVFPFAYEVFGGKGWDAQMAQAYAKDQAQFGFGKSISDLLWLPWRLAMTPLNVAVANDGQIKGLPFWPLSDVLPNNNMGGKFDVNGMLLQSVIGPALLALGLPAIFIKRKPQVVKFIGWSFLFFWVFWAFTSQQIRYLLPSLALLCLPCGWALCEYSKRPILKYVAVGGTALWLLFGPYYTATQMSATWPVVLGWITPDEYLKRTTPPYEIMKWASENTPKHARFALYGEPRTFYLNRDYWWADDAHNNLIDYSLIQDADDFVKALRSQKSTHIIVNREAGRNGGFGEPPAHLQAAVEAGQVKQLHETRGYAVYEILEMKNAE